MANCHDLFTTFYDDKVKLNETKREELRKSRDSIRDKIKKHFKEKLEVKQPKFWGQGSYMIRTQVSKLPEQEYDIDDGLYLQHLENDNWPTPQTVHNWVVAAVEGHTNTDPIDKNTCVRVIYARSYHVDIPIYVADGDGYKLAHKSLGWTPSDPKAITEWFSSEIKNKSNQLRRIVQYLKAWKDFTQSTTKLPSGLALTVLAVNHYSSHARDDNSVVSTVRNIKNALDVYFSVTKPAIPNENLLEGYSDTRKNYFLDKLQAIIDKGQVALDTEDKAKASQQWIALFGDRFPEYKPPKDDSKESQAMRTGSPAILGTKNDRSA